MGDYTKLGMAEANQILKLYDIGSLRSFVGLSLGISNSNYRLTTDKGNFLLKISNDKDQTQLRAEQEILTYLQILSQLNLLMNCFMKLEEQASVNKMQFGSSILKHCTKILERNFL